MDPRSIVETFVDLTSKGFDRESVLVLLESRKPPAPKRPPAVPHRPAPGNSITARAVQLLQKGAPLTVDEIAVALGEKRLSVISCIARAVRKGRLARTEDGKIALRPFPGGSL